MKRNQQVALALGLAAGAVTLLPKLLPRRPLARGTALITGASSGIGAAFARELSSRGFDLILLARREDLMRALADELAQQYGTRSRIWVADLSDEDVIEEVAKRVAVEPDLAMLVNNAGFGNGGLFAEADIDTNQDMVRVHILAAQRLARAALPGMIARHEGAVINVASLGGFIPLPTSATCSATKSFLISFSRTLGIELAGTGVQVQALCPGFTPTEMTNQKGWSRVEDVVRASLDGLERGEVVVLPGIITKAIYFFASQPISAAIIRALMVLYMRVMKKRK